MIGAPRSHPAAPSTKIGGGDPFSSEDEDAAPPTRSPRESPSASNTRPPYQCDSAGTSRAGSSPRAADAVSNVQARAASERRMRRGRARSPPPDLRAKDRPGRPADGENSTA